MFYYENILNEEDFSNIKNSFTNPLKIELFKGFKREREQLVIPKKKLLTLRNFINNKKIIWEDYFGYSNLSIEMIFGSIYNEGHFFEKHVDNIKYETGEKIYYRKISALYLVQKCEIGGEFKINNEIQNLKENSMIIFKSNTEHEVTKILKGKRFSIFCFLGDV